VPEILARLDRSTGTRVMCGSIGNTCRGELARVAVSTGVAVADQRVLCMLPGWKQTARGHFTVNNHSKPRGAKATAAVRRRVLPRDQLASRRRASFRQKIPTELDTNELGYGLAPDVFVIESIPAAGILADCPVCGRTNVLRGPQLGVAQR
jgi:hypothetical protein